MTTNYAFHAALAAAPTEYKLFCHCMFTFLSNSDAPKFHESLSLFDSLARIAIREPNERLPYERLLLDFCAGVVSIRQVQTGMRRLLQNAPDFLRGHFAGFLTMPLKTMSQQQAAKHYLCCLLGLPL